jgi:hypothetical protein
VAQLPNDGRRPKSTWHDYQTTGVVPQYLKYQSINLCRLLHNQTIGLMGDSMMPQFAHSLMGKMLGYNDQVSVRLPLCPPPTPSNSDNNNVNDHNDSSSGRGRGRGRAAELLFMRWNRYYADHEEHRARVVELLRESDVVIMNFGAHALFAERRV